MAIRPVENQMMLSRPPEAVNEKMRDIKQQGLNAGVMKYEEDVNTEQEMSRPQAAQEVENSRIHEDEHRGHEQQEKEEKTEKEKAEEEKKKTLEQMASDRILGLPVERGKYAQRAEHKIDIVL